MTDAQPQTVNDRVYEIRRALGPDRKTPLSQGEFAKRVNAIASRYGMKATYDHSVISKIENGIRNVSIEEVPLFAALDPKERGWMWMAWGRVSEGSITLDPSTDHQLTEEEAERGRKKIAEKARGARSGTKRSAGGGKRGRS